MKLAIHELNFSPTRAELYLLFEWLEQQNTKDDRIRYYFFVDNVMRDRSGKLRTMSIVRDDRSTDGRLVLCNIAAEKFATLWRAAYLPPDPNYGWIYEISRGRFANREVEDACAESEYREVIRDPRLPCTASLNPPTIWLLRHFTMEEESRIRSLLETDIEGMDEVYDTHTYAFAGCPFKDDGMHSVQELLDLFQRCDPFSPVYDPDFCPSLRFGVYPRHFLAIDDKILDEESQDDIGR